MTAPARRRKVSGGARPGCPPGVLARGCPAEAERWEHPPRPALRTLILAGGRRRPGGAAGSPAPSPVPGSWLGGTQTTAPGAQGRRGPETRRPRIVPLPFRWRCTCFRGSHRWGAEPASRGGGALGGSAVTSTGRRPGASEAGLAAGARFAAQLCSALGNFCPPPAGPIFCEFWGCPSSPSRPAVPSRGGGAVSSRGWGTQCTPPPPPLARLPAPPPLSRSLRKLRPSRLLRSRGGPSRRRPPPWEAACFLPGTEGRVEDVVSRSPAARGAGRGTRVEDTRQPSLPLGAATSLLGAGGRGRPRAEEGHRGREDLRRHPDWPGAGRVDRRRVLLASSARGASVMCWL